MKNAPVVVMMTKDEAIKTRDKINNHVGSVAALVLDMYKREGWRALGYKNWTDCMSKEFGHGRSRIYQLLDEAQVAAELKESMGDQAPPLSGAALRALKDAPKRSRAGVIKATGSDSPTADEVKESVAKKSPAWKSSGVNKKAPAPKKQSIAEQAKDDEKLQQALAILGGTCGRPFRQAIEDETIEMSRADIIHLSEQDDETMMAAEKLISVNRWTLKRALHFLNAMPTLKTKLEELTWHAVASPQGKWDGHFGAFYVIVEVDRKKL